MTKRNFDEVEYRQQLIDMGTDAESAGRIAAKTAQERQKQHQVAATLASVNEQLSFGDNPQPQGADSEAVAETGNKPPKNQSKAPNQAAAIKIIKPQETPLSVRQRNLIAEALEIEADDAKRADATGYMARTLAQATLPHLDPKLPLGSLYYRNTGKLVLTVAPTSPKHGIPYGSVPRVILAWLCTEAVKTKSRTLSLGHSQSDFLEKINLHNNGKDIKRFREQALRLFKSVISVEYSDDEDGDESARLLISDQSHVFWHPKKQDQRALWDSTLELSTNFFNEIVGAPVPINLDIYRALGKSPMEMDIYAWLTYRMFVLLRSGRPAVRIPWVSLKMQLGAGYPDTKRGLADFKANFKRRLRNVLVFYPEAASALEDDKKGGCLIIKPTTLHINHKKQGKP